MTVYTQESECHYILMWGAHCINYIFCILDTLASRALLILGRLTLLGLANS